MTITSIINRVSYNGDGATTNFDVPFAFFGEDELDVIERVAATGAETGKTLTNDYTVSGGNGSIGTVVAAIAPPSTVSWTVIRRTSQTQEIDYTDNDPFPADTHELGLDRVTMMAQDSTSAVDRALRFPATDLPTLDPEMPNSMERAAKFLAFDANGLPIASSGPTGNSSIPVSSYIETLVDDVDAATARQTLGLIIGTDVAPAGVSGDFVGRVATFVGVTPPTGWLLLNGDTIGNIASGAAQANAQYVDLFKLFWDSMADAQAMVSTGRGVSAQADWDAGKTLTMPDGRGRSVLGTGQGASLTNRVNGVTGGAETHQLTEAEMPAHNHDVDTGAGLAGANTGTPAPGVGPATTHSTNIGSKGGDGAHNNMQPFLALNYIVKF